MGARGAPAGVGTRDGSRHAHGRGDPAKPVACCGRGCGTPSRAWAARRTKRGRFKNTPAKLCPPEPSCPRRGRALRERGTCPL